MMSAALLFALLSGSALGDEAPILMPALVEDANPEYPQEARAQGISGEVLLLLDVDAAGTVTSVEILESPHELLSLSARSSGWLLRFEPATQAGEPVPVQIQYRYRFDLSTTDEQGEQVPGSLSGQLVDSSGMAVPGAVVLLRLSGSSDAPRTLTTNDSGEFQAAFLPSGSWEMRVETSRSYLEATVVIQAGENTERVFTIEDPSDVETMVIHGWRTWREVERGAMVPDEGTVTSSYTLTRRDIEATPGSLEDVARAIHSLPGIVSDGDMLATFNARGGDTSEVVFMLDRVPLQNPFHLAGFNSIFNPDLISTVQFYVSGAPAEVPAGTSAVLAVETWDGSPRQGSSELDGAIDISASSLRFLLMGPIGERANVALAARRSYMETYFQIMKWANIIDTSFAAPEFSELSGRFVFRPTPEHRLMFTAMRAGDSLAIVDSEDDSLITVDATFELENSLQLLSLDHRYIPSEAFTWQTTAALTWDRAFLLRDLAGEYEQEVVTQRAYGRSDVTITHEKHELVSGAEVSYSLVNANGEIEDSRATPTWAAGPISELDLALIELSSGMSAPELSAYLQDTWSGPVRVRLGGRATWQGTTGEVLLSPRGGLSVPLPTATIPKASVGLYHNTPRDPRIYDPQTGNPDIRSERAMHYIVGIDQGFPLPGEALGGLLRVEAYFIELDDLVVNPDNAAAVAAGTSYTNDGTGTNRGFDVLLATRGGRAQGMLTYNFLIAERTNPLNDRFDTTFAPGQDQRHGMGAAVEYQLTPYWRLTSRYTFHTGRPTADVEAVGLEDKVDFTCLNCSRMGNFHNLDLRGEWRKVKDNYRLSFYAEVLNVTNAKSDFIPIVSIEDGVRDDAMLYHLPIRPFLGLRADF